MRVKLSETMADTLRWLAAGANGVGGSDRYSTYEALAKRGLITITREPRTNPSGGTYTLTVYTVTTEGIAWIYASGDSHSAVSEEVAYQAGYLYAQTPDATLDTGDDLVMSGTWYAGYHDHTAGREHGHSLTCADPDHQACTTIVDAVTETIVTEIIAASEPVPVADTFTPTTGCKCGVCVDPIGQPYVQCDDCGRDRMYEEGIGCRCTRDPNHTSSRQHAQAWGRMLADERTPYEHYRLARAHADETAQRENWYTVVVGYVRDRAHTEALEVEGIRREAGRWGAILADGRMPADVAVSAVEYADHTQEQETAAWYRAVTDHVIGHAHRHATVIDRYQKIMDDIAALTRRTPSDDLYEAGRAAHNIGTDGGVAWGEAFLGTLVDLAHERAWDDYHTAVYRWYRIRCEWPTPEPLIDAAEDAARARWADVTAGPSVTVWYETAIAYVVDRAHIEALRIHRIGNAENSGRMVNYHYTKAGEWCRWTHTPVAAHVTACPAGCPAGAIVKDTINEPS